MGERGSARVARLAIGRGAGVGLLVAFAWMLSGCVDTSGADADATYAVQRATARAHEAATPSPSLTPEASPTAPLPASPTVPPTATFAPTPTRTATAQPTATVTPIPEPAPVSLSG